MRNLLAYRNVTKLKTERLTIIKSRRKILKIKEENMAYFIFQLDELWRRGTVDPVFQGVVLGYQIRDLLSLPALN